MATISPTLSNPYVSSAQKAFTVRMKLVQEATLRSRHFLAQSANIVHEGRSPRQTVATTITCRSRVVVLSENAFLARPASHALKQLRSKPHPSSAPKATIAQLVASSSPVLQANTALQAQRLLQLVQSALFLTVSRRFQMQFARLVLSISTVHIVE